MQSTNISCNLKPLGFLYIIPNYRAIKYDHPFDFVALYDRTSSVMALCVTAINLCINIYIYLLVGEFLFFIYFQRACSLLMDKFPFYQ